MDGDRFDALARVLSSETTRRGVVALLGGIAATVSLLIDPTSAERRRRRRKHKQRKKRKRRKNAEANRPPQPQGGGSENNGRRGSACDGAGTRARDPAQAGAGLDLSRCNFEEAGLVGASLTGIAATGANFAGAHTFGANFSSANLDGACFTNASLRSANLRSVNAAKADFAKADLCGADLRGANISPTQIAVARVCCSTLLPDGNPAVPCPPGRTCCGAGCVDLATDPLSCGTCGHACDAGEICCAGRCVQPVAGGGCQEDGVQCLTHEHDLQDAIDAAQSGATIYLCEGIWYLQQGVLIDKDLQIIGGANGGTSILDSNSSTQLLGIATNRRVSISNMTFRGGFAGYGGGIFNQGDLALGDCTVIDNGAIAYGGGIYNEGDVHIVRGAVQENTAYNDAFDYGGYGIYNDEGSVFVQGASISYNKLLRTNESMSGYGAGVYNYYGQLDLTAGSAITENEATSSGGGIYNQGGTVNLPSATLVTGNKPDNCAGSAVANCIG